MCAKAEVAAVEDEQEAGQATAVQEGALQPRPHSGPALRNQPAASRGDAPPLLSFTWPYLFTIPELLFQTVPVRGSRLFLLEARGCSC